MVTGDWCCVHLLGPDWNVVWMMWSSDVWIMSRRDTQWAIDTRIDLQIWEHVINVPWPFLKDRLSQTCLSQLFSASNTQMLAYFSIQRQVLHLILALVNLQPNVWVCSKDFWKHLFAILWFYIFWYFFCNTLQ